jgi:mono/diheme cytochrome c family protein
MLKKIALVALTMTSPAMSQDKAFTLQTPDALVQTGFIKHLLPRFSLKTGIRINSVPDMGDAVFGAEGTPVFRQGQKTWHLSKVGGPHTDAFEKWLLSDVGIRTIEAYAPDGEPLFSAKLSVKTIVQSITLTGDAVLGESVSRKHCGRCHVVSETNRMNAIGSTPSFLLMRGLPDWQERFETFFMRRPHPAFTQVQDVTDPFAKNLPSPIVPLEVTLEQIDAITAYVATIAPADLGAPLQSQ